jgi:ParB/RepB/Spo0J family partition protein
MAQVLEAKGAVVDVGKVALIPPDRLEPMANQPRGAFDPDLVRQLADNIVALRSRGQGIQGSGFIDVVKAKLPSLALDDEGRLKDGARLIITSGETRWRAATLANERQPLSVPVVPVIVENIPDDAAMFELAYFANAHRRDLSDLDEGQALLRIKNARELTLEQLAAYVNKSMGYVQNRIDVIGAAPDVLAVFDARPKALSIVRRINTVKDPAARQELVALAKLKDTTAKDIEDAIRAHKAGVTVEEFQGEQERQGYQRQYEKEAQNASISARTPARHVAASGNVEDALLSALRQATFARDALQNATLTAGAKRKARVPATKLGLVLKEIEALLKGSE